MGVGDAVLVNNMMFCTDHGAEFCAPCFCDHRICNNIAMDFDFETEGRIQKALGHHIDHRPSLNAYALGARLAKSGKERGTYNCVTHGTVDCGDCFNWTKLILESVGLSVVKPKSQAQNLTSKSFDVHDVD